MGLGCGGLGLLAPASLEELRGGLPSGGEGGRDVVNLCFFRDLEASSKRTRNSLSV